MELVDGVGLNFLIEQNQATRRQPSIISHNTRPASNTCTRPVLHRDICPRNVMINKEGVIKIIDLGLAIPYTPDFCKPGNRTGTTNYLAPELIKRTPTDHRVDCFALGVTAFETFVGDLPWEKGSSMEVFRRIVNQPPRDPRELRSDLDEKVAKFLLKAVERDPNLRFQTPGEFRAAILQLSERW